MNPIQYLKQASAIHVKIRQLAETYATLRQSLSSKGIDYSKDKVQTSPTDRTTDIMAECIDIMAEINAKTLEMDMKRTEILGRIHNLEDTRYIRVLYKRYIEFKSFDEIADECGYQFRYILRLHTDALISFAEFNKDVIEMW